MKEIEGKVIWIIGASTGIGAALARHLDQQGAELILSARSEDKLDALNKDLKAGHMVLPLDIEKPECFKNAFSDFDKKKIKIDSVLFMAAVYDPLSVENIDFVCAKKHIDINLLSAFALLEYLLPHFKQNGSGQLVLCASVAGYLGLPNGQPYSASKAGLISLAETLRTELPKDNIDVKLINPGFVDTPLTEKNSFKMPMMITADKAASHIVKALTARRFEIRFPWLFTSLMRLLSRLPYGLRFLLLTKK